MSQRTVRIPYLVLLVSLATPSRLAGQGPWTPHQPPCKLSTGHYLVKGGQLYLKTGIETRFQDQRGERFVEARAALLRAITEERQRQNPGAWYYLGRAYAELQDFAGADSAFRRAAALAPDCAEDIAGHAVRLSGLALNRAQAAWDAGQRDSSLAWFRLAAALDSTDRHIPLMMSRRFAGSGEADSAARYLARGLDGAVPREALGPGARQAALAVAQTYETRALEQAPAVQTVARSRAVRDSTARLIAVDSTMLAGMVERVRPRRARLSSGALAAFRRDSSRVAARIAGNRAVLDSLRGSVTVDSATVVGPLGPAVEQFGTYVRRYPDDADAVLTWVRLLSAAGHGAALDSAVTWLRDSSRLTVPGLVRVADALYRDWLNGPARGLLDHALERSPYDHGALAVLTGVLYVTGDPTGLLAVARRRLDLAPLDPDAARAVAIAWDLSFDRDSALKYLALSDGGLGWNLRAAAFGVGRHTTSLEGQVTNAGAAPRPALELVFEFLDAGGAVLGAVPVTIPPLAPGARAPFQARLAQGGAASWRYRPRS
jgi:tetratricopeptide (TPR) repeat protein